jgi:hypothetical protein
VNNLLADEYDPNKADSASSIDFDDSDILHESYNITDAQIDEEMKKIQTFEDEYQQVNVNATRAFQKEFGID